MSLGFKKFNGFTFPQRTLNAKYSYFQKFVTMTKLLENYV